MKGEAARGPGQYALALFSCSRGKGLPNYLILYTLFTYPVKPLGAAFSGATRLQITKQVVKFLHSSTNNFHNHAIFMSKYFSTVIANAGLV